MGERHEQLKESGRAAINQLYEEEKRAGRGIAEGMFTWVRTSPAAATLRQVAREIDQEASGALSRGLKFLKIELRRNGITMPGETKKEDRR